MPLSHAAVEHPAAAYLDCEETRQRGTMLPVGWQRQRACDGLGACVPPGHAIAAEAHDETEDAEDTRVLPRALLLWAPWIWPLYLRLPSSSWKRCR